MGASTSLHRCRALLHPIITGHDGHGAWNWVPSSVHPLGSDAACAARCDAEAQCEGYMTEDWKMCGLPAGRLAGHTRDAKGGGRTNSTTPVIPKQQCDAHTRAHTGCSNAHALPCPMRAAGLVVQPGFRAAGVDGERRNHCFAKVALPPAPAPPSAPSLAIFIKTSGRDKFFARTRRTLEGWGGAACARLEYAVQGAGRGVRGVVYGVVPLRVRRGTHLSPVGLRGNIP